MSPPSVPDSRAFAVVCNSTYFPGLKALINSIYAYHATELALHVFSADLPPAEREWIEAHPLPCTIWPLSSLPLKMVGIWEAKQQVLAHLIPFARVVYLLDADLVLTARVDDIFELAGEGKIVSSSDGGDVHYGEAYLAYGKDLVNRHHRYINSGALCLDVVRHWDLAGLWAFSSLHSAYSPGAGKPISLPGHGDQGTFNAVAALLGKTCDFHVLPEGPWCDSTKGCLVRIRATDPVGRLTVWNETDSAPQRLVHSSGPKWWTTEGEQHLQRFGDKLACFHHFAGLREVPAPAPPKVKPILPKGAGPHIRVLIGICSARMHERRRQAVRSTWLRDLAPGAAALFFVGQGGPHAECGLVCVPASDGYHHLPEKVHSFYEYALRNYSFDFLFKCDDDTYVRTDKLLALATDDIHFLGSDHICSGGYASGGAGYLMSRLMLEKLTAAPPETHGAEDVIFTQRAKRTGLPLNHSAAFLGTPTAIPCDENEVVTSHPFGPEEMRVLHRGLFMHRPFLNLAAKHPCWTGEVRLHDDGGFFGGAASPNGVWRSLDDGERLLLAWHHWSPDTLQLTPKGFTGEKLQLAFAHPTDVDRWRELQKGRVELPRTKPSIFVEYKGQLGNRLFQFAAGFALAQRTGALLEASPIDGFPMLDSYRVSHTRVRPMSAGRGEMYLKAEECEKHLASGGDVVVNGYFQRYEIVRPFKAELKSLFVPETALDDELLPAPDDVVLHLRLGDYFSTNGLSPAEYPMAQILDLLKRLSFARLFIVTDSPRHQFIATLQGACNGIVHSTDSLSAFRFLYKAHRLILTPSTFGWWAAWLSEARKIYFPKRYGHWSRHYPALDLWVDDEDRYESY